MREVAGKYVAIASIRADRRFELRVLPVRVPIRLLVCFVDTVKIVLLSLLLFGGADGLTAKDLNTISKLVNRITEKQDTLHVRKLL